MTKKSTPEYRRYVCDLCYRKQMLRVGTHYCDCWPGGTRMTDIQQANEIKKAMTRLIGYPPEGVS